MPLYTIQEIREKFSRNNGRYKELISDAGEIYPPLFRLLPGYRMDKLISFLSDNSNNFPIQKARSLFQDTEVFDMGCGQPNYDSNRLPELAQRMGASSYTGIDFNLGETKSHTHRESELLWREESIEYEGEQTTEKEGFIISYLKFDILEFLASVPTPTLESKRKVIVFSGIDSIYDYESTTGGIYHYRPYNQGEFDKYWYALHSELILATKEEDVLISGACSDIPDKNLLTKLGWSGTEDNVMHSGYNLGIHLRK